jgi:hypothetical protein
MPQTRLSEGQWIGNSECVHIGLVVHLETWIKSGEGAPNRFVNQCHARGPDNASCKLHCFSKMDLAEFKPVPYKSFYVMGQVFVKLGGKV